METSTKGLTEYPTTGSANVIVGRLAQLLLVGFWAGGLLSPFILLALLVFKLHIAATALALVMFLPYFVPLPKTPLLADFLVRAAEGFGHGGAKLVSEVPFNVIDKNKGLFLYSPHGVFSWGYVLHGGLHKGCRPLKGVVSSLLLHFPIFRILALVTDSVIGSDRATFVNTMKSGGGFGLIPGGFEEASTHKLGRDRVFLRDRKGFVKYALQYGYRLWPIYTFGEVDTYSIMPVPQALALWLNKYQIPAVVPVGVWWCPVLPKPAKLVTVIGKPLVLPTIPNPSAEEVDDWHSKYLQHLTDLYDRYKGLYGDPKKELEIH